MIVGSGVVLFAWAALYFMIIRRKPALAAAACVALMAWFSASGFLWLLPEAEAGFASKKMVEFYRKNYSPPKNNFLLSSKLFIRGVAFYGDNLNIGVLAEDPRGLFYTQPAVPTYSNFDDLSKIARQDFPVYCFLRQKELELLKHILKDRFSVSVLRSEAGRVLARLDLR